MITMTNVEAEPAEMPDEHAPPATKIHEAGRAPTGRRRAGAVTAALVSAPAVWCGSSVSSGIMGRARSGQVIPARVAGEPTPVSPLRQEVFMSDDSLDEYRQAPAEWVLDQELEVAAEVYGPEPKGIRTDWSELSDEELLERYRSLLGFDLKWES